MEIQQEKVRAKLAPRREPYWRHLERGLSLGFRKSPAGGTWIARWRDPDTRKQHYKPLGSVLDVAYADAAADATKWRGQAESGVVKAEAVKAALKDYIAELKTGKRERTATETEAYFKLLVYGDDAPPWGRTFGSIRLDKLRAAHVEAFRNALLEDNGRSLATANRIMSRVKAALNLAFKRDKAPSAPWRKVGAFTLPQAEGQRDVYLEVGQRRAILAECSPALTDFLTGILYTAARPGDLARANVGDLDTRGKTLRLVTRKGRGQPRTYTALLTDDALAMFKRHAKDKEKNLPLLTNAEGRRWEKKHWAEKLRQAVAAANEKKAKLPAGIVAYSFRHSAITDWVRGGMNVGDVAKQCGTSIKQINDHYYHSGDTRQIRATIKVV